MSDERPESAGSSIERLHAEVDAAARLVAERHGARLRCAVGCSSCCIDGIRVFEVEAARIRQRHPELLATALPHATGACAFLADDGACRVYDERPYVCRTQGLPLRWTEPRGDGVVEWRDICPLNEPGDPPIDALPPDACWTLGPVEGRLAAIEQRDGDPSRRVPLRSLFRRCASRPEPTD